MKQISFLLWFLVFFSFSGKFIFSQTQNPIKDYPGIPILTYSGENLFWIDTDSEYVKMESAGIFATEVTNMSDSISDRIEDTNIKAIHNQVGPPFRPFGTFDFTTSYTEARYSVWEAEGTNPADGITSLLFNHDIGIIEDGAVKTIDGEENGTLIYGPYYKQEIYYAAKQQKQIINYTADFILRKAIVDTENPPLPDDTLCILQVTTSTTHANPWYIDSSYVIKDSVIKYSDLGSAYDTISLNYDLVSIPRYFMHPDTLYFRAFANYIQFKVLWKGNSNLVRLYVDKIILSDQRGWDLINYALGGININTQINYEGVHFSNKVAGWMCADEPGSIDQYAPIKKVQEIIDANPNGKGGMWIAFGSGWNGRNGESGPTYLDPFGSYSLVTFDEFHRRVKKAQLWFDYYLYDNPCKDTSTDGHCLGDWRAKNIEFLVDSGYARFYDKENVIWGASIQTGKYLNPPDSSDTSHTASWLGLREINSSELLYHTNIALLSGAKLLSYWTYFAIYDEASDTLKRSALVHAYWPYGRIGDPSDVEYTPKWHTLKDTIAPRLNGLMGKTLKELNAVTHTLGINARVDPETANPFAYINYIEAIGGMSETCLVELGLFAEQQYPDKKYFMPLNRYYSTLHNLTFGLKDLGGYNNWIVTDYIDTTSFTLFSTNGIAEFTDDIYPGDAKLYSIWPVVKYGGNLVYNETITGTQTLYETMMIDNGALLTVNGTYNCEADIIINDGSIVTTNGGTINFLNGSKLIIEGSAYVNGTSSDLLGLNFTSPEEENGILVTETGEFTIIYCSISNAETGIKALSNSGRKIIESSYFTNCQGSAINIIGQTGEGFEDAPPPRITNCLIFNPVGDHGSFGISAANLNEIEISYNAIINTDLGIYLSQVAQVYVLDNYLISNSLQAPGIFMESSEGDIRGNEITGYSDGIHLGNSSPNIGQNIIYENKYHGIFIGSGSVPYMVGQLSGEPPEEYAISGYNTINYNGGFLDPEEPPHNDGSEIYLSDAYVQINEGCNSIVDNRIPEGELVYTQILMNGTLSQGGRELPAENNFWDEHPVYPLSTRFGDLYVDYDPYLSIPCEIQEEDFLFVENSYGEVVDTIYSTGRTTNNPTALEINYSSAEGKFLSGEYAAAKTKYETIISGEDSVYDKLKAYNRLFTIGKLTGEDESYFSGLQNIYNNAITAENDSLINKILQQNILLSDVSKGEYISAITGFDNIIQQVPESDEAFYAEIDILTTSLLADTGSGQLGKIGNGKYIVKSSSDYMKKLNYIMKKHFGIKEGDKKENLLPTEYVLYQNYPNPFNPTTIIKYSLPEASKVKLTVYDILGREIKVLINEWKEPGYYKVNFDAGNLASGVYIYRIQTDNFVNSQKMVLVR